MAPANEIVWHYTDAVGFMNIVGSDELWASQMSGLNDASELLFGSEQVCDACELAAVQPAVSDDDRQWLLSIKEWILAESARDHLYVFSASLAGDSLNQWMHYGSGGYAIGLDPEIELGYLLNDGTVAKREAGLTSAKGWSAVSYGSDLKLVNLVIQIILTARSSDNDDWNEWQQLTALRTLAALQKHIGFQDERETRYLVPLSPGHSARRYRRSQSGTIVSYVPLVTLNSSPGAASGKSKLPIKAVRVGPPLERELEIKTVERFLEDSGYTDIDVSNSLIPYAP